MSMYALQVMTGMEAEITQKLRGKGVDARLQSAATLSVRCDCTTMRSRAAALKL